MYVVVVVLVVAFVVVGVILVVFLVVFLVLLLFLCWLLAIGVVGSVSWKRGGDDMGCVVSKCCYHGRTS